MLENSASTPSTNLASSYVTFAVLSMRKVFWVTAKTGAMIHLDYMPRFFGVDILSGVVLRGGLEPSPLYSFALH